jgi:hypothetical protein
MSRRFFGDGILGLPQQGICRVVSKMVKFREGPPGTCPGNAMFPFKFFFDNIRLCRAEKYYLSGDIAKDALQEMNYER